MAGGRGWARAGRRRSAWHDELQGVWAGGCMVTAQLHARQLGRSHTRSTTRVCTVHTWEGEAREVVDAVAWGWEEVAEGREAVAAAALEVGSALATTGAAALVAAGAGRRGLCEGGICGVLAQRAILGVPAGQQQRQGVQRECEACSVESKRAVCNKYKQGGGLLQRRARGRHPASRQPDSRPLQQPGYSPAGARCTCLQSAPAGSRCPPCPGCS